MTPSQMFGRPSVYCGCKWTRLVMYQSGCLMLHSHNHCLFSLSAAKATTLWLKQPFCSVANKLKLCFPTTATFLRRACRRLDIPGTTVVQVH